jgi:carboxymethylenebutenolidase
MLRSVPGTVVDIKTDDGVADAYISRPDGEQRHPGVLFIMDAYGLRPWIETMADRIAAGGYVVLAPNVFYRAGRAPVIEMPDLSDADERASFFRSVRSLMAQVSPDGLAPDGAAYLDYLARFATEPVAITGYCMGARVAWRIAAAHPDRVAALAGFHGGGLATDAPDSPHRSAGQIRAEAYLGHADQDASMPPEQIAVLDRALDDAGVRHVTEVYDGAMHGYTMGDTPSYNEAASERHFEALFGLLERTLAPV